MKRQFKEMDWTYFEEVVMSVFFFSPLSRPSFLRMVASQEKGIVWVVGKGPYIKYDRNLGGRGVGELQSV